MITDRFSWDRPIKDIWKELSDDPQFVPEMPYFQKLSLLAQLKSADAMAGYTKWLTAVTVIIAVGTVVQAVFVALTYFYPPDLFK
jgi:hypothetical protein